MTDSLIATEEKTQLSPKIIVVGVGGAGGNAVNTMVREQIQGVDFLVANTDAQALSVSDCQSRLQLGNTITRGLGAGSKAEIGQAAAEEQIDDILDAIEGSHMLFITAGMGGGTGTGAAPVIARVAREQGMLTVGVVTKPFHFEGAQRMKVADAGIKELQKYVDTLIVIPNQNLFRIANEQTTFADAFKMADDVLLSGVRGVTDLMVMPGLINLDFADIRAVMTEMGKAMMGTGEAAGDQRAVKAAEAAISNPLLDEISMHGARGVLINITGGADMTLFEVDEAANRVREEIDADANIIFGSTFDPDIEGSIRVSVVATGIDIYSSEGTVDAPEKAEISDNLNVASAFRTTSQQGDAPVDLFGNPFKGGADQSENSAAPSYPTAADYQAAGTVAEQQNNIHGFSPELFSTSAGAAPKDPSYYHSPTPFSQEGQHAPSIAENEAPIQNTQRFNPDSYSAESFEKGQKKTSFLKRIFSKSKTKKEEIYPGPDSPEQNQYKNQSVEFPAKASQGQPSYHQWPTAEQAQHVPTPPQPVNPIPGAGSQASMQECFTQESENLAIPAFLRKQNKSL